VGVRREVIRSLELNLLPLTQAKHSGLSLLFTEYLRVANEILRTLNSKRPNSETALHHLTYKAARAGSKLPAQLVCAARQEVWAKRRHRITAFRRLPISCNVPRSGSLTQTRRCNPILSVSTLHERIGLPVAKDGAWRRLSKLLAEGWAFTEFKLLSAQMIRVSIRRQFEIEEPTLSGAVVGVDVGVGTLAAITVFSGGGVRRQLYLGRDVYHVKRDLGIRRSKLQAYASVGSGRARRVLRNLRGYEQRYTRTRCYEVAHNIVRVAKQYGASIAIENLRGLRNSKLGRKSSRKVKRMPYSFFRQALQSVAWQSGVEVTLVNPRYTSQTCPKCHQRGSRNGTLFKCKGCGFTANADRTASVNIARLLWERVKKRDETEPRFAQFSQSGAAVNQPARCDDSGQPMVRNQEPTTSTSHLSQIGGS
jgi:IS605 OrfB family transposase